MNFKFRNIFQGGAEALGAPSGRKLLGAVVPDTPITPKMLNLATGVGVGAGALGAGAVAALGGEDEGALQEQVDRQVAAALAEYKAQGMSLTEAVIALGKALEAEIGSAADQIVG